MNWIQFGPQGVGQLASEPAQLPSEGFLWLDVKYDDADFDIEGLRSVVQRLTGARIHELHLQDATNLQHPSYFDSTREYEMLIFRKLSTGEVKPLEERPAGRADKRRMLQEIVTRPVTFFLFDRLLVTVRLGASRTLEQMRQRILDPGPSALAERSRLARSPGELMLRMLNGMVDRYLELREPLADRLDRWQRDLLDPQRPFTNWSALLEARIELRKLENLSEGQYDALTEMRDSYLEKTPDAGVSDSYLVRLNDVMEHVQRVLHHSRRLEASAESAVQLHFSANTHQTNEIVRTLTAIAAIFAPLTLITGVFGMNFEHMPLLRDLHGFWWTIAGMGTVVIVMLLYFWARRILNRPRAPRPPRWLR